MFSVVFTSKENRRPLAENRIYIHTYVLTHLNYVLSWIIVTVFKFILEILLGIFCR